MLKQTAVVLAVVGVGDGRVATVEGVMRITGTEPEIAAKIGVFHRLAVNCAKIGDSSADVHEVGTQRGGAGGRGAAPRYIGQAWMQVAPTLGATPSAKRGRFEDLSTPPSKTARK